MFYKTEINMLDWGLHKNKKFPKIQKILMYLITLTEYILSTFITRLGGMLRRSVGSSYPFGSSRWSGSLIILASLYNLVVLENRTIIL